MTIIQKLQLNFPYLSPPVPMHGGLLCITFCLSVCLSGFTQGTLYTTTTVYGVQLFSLRLSKYNLITLRKSRWAHINVKLQFFNSSKDNSGTDPGFCMGRAETHKVGFFTRGTESRLILVYTKVVFEDLRSGAFSGGGGGQGPLAPATKSATVIWFDLLQGCRVPTCRSIFI